ncbi:hypothetical protein M0R45_036215 [Rubus argutus]|uniref:SUN domain-containing protein n=1 Tax=Rubus argutus TaxID=59490 RepID=A0AAW1VY83_RUBAR
MSASTTQRADDRAETRDLSHQSIRSETAVDRSAQTRRTGGTSTVSPPSARRRSRKSVGGSQRPRWLTLLRIFGKWFGLLLFVGGLGQILTRLAYGPSAAVPMAFTDLEGRIAEVEASMKETTKMLQVGVDVASRKIDKEVGELRKEVDKKIEDRGVALAGELRKLEAKTEGLERWRAFGALYGGERSNWWTSMRNGVHYDADKMLRPSFGEPGQCFPLKGSSGFVQIKLRTAIIPEAITLEHVSKSVAYDRTSAPKDCRVSAWLRGVHDPDLEVIQRRCFLLAEFTYDLEKSNAQTVTVLDSAVSNIVDTVRLDFTSNHGSPSHTCIYRLRVHGHEPEAVSVMAMHQS